MSAIALRDHGRNIDDGLLQFLSPLGLEHINPTGDYVRRNSTEVGPEKLRPLRPLPLPLTHSMIRFLRSPPEGCFKGQNLGEIAFTVHHAKKDPGVFVPLF